MMSKEEKEGEKCLHAAAASHLFLLSFPFSYTKP